MRKKDATKNPAEKSSAFSVLQRVGRSFMFPIALLPVAGLLLGVGKSFSNQAMVTTYGWQSVLGEGTILYNILKIMGDVGDVIFANLPVIFAMGVALGMAKKEKEVATLASVIGFFVMHQTIGTLITLTNTKEQIAASMESGHIGTALGITTLQMGVFGGIVVGLGVAALHNKFYKIKLPAVLSFFGGTRFVPIITTVVYLFVGVAMFFIWPVIQEGITFIGTAMKDAGYAGTFLYGLIERALIPFGLHHVFYIPFWQTGLGGQMTIDGTLVQGAQNIFFAQLANPGSLVDGHFAVEATRYMSGKFIFMIFGLPGAALAMYRCALPEKRKEVGGLLLSAALTAMLTGITEPLEFTFLFVAPALYAVHCVLAGLAYMLAHVFNATVGMTFSGGIIDLSLFGILQGNDKTSWIWIPIIGVVYFVIYYFLFRFVITKFNLKTPGRDKTEEAKLYTKADYLKRKEGQSAEDMTSSLILAGLGKNENISNLDCCATRLRVTVKDVNLVNKDVLTQSGAAGTIIKGNGVQVIYGPNVNVIKSNLEDYLAKGGTAAEIDGAEASSSEEEKKSEEVKAPSKGEKHTLKAIADGEIVEITNVPDPVFAEKILGDGVAILPSNGKICSPADGTVVDVTETLHAYCISTDDGLDILVHIGLETVNLKGEGFKPNVKVGDKVKAGDLLAVADLDLIKEKGCELYTPIIITNADAVSNVKAGSGKAKAGETDVLFYEV